MASFSLLLLCLHVPIMSPVDNNGFEAGTNCGLALFVYDVNGQRTQTIALTTSGGVTSRVITTYPFPNYEEERRQTLQTTGCNPFCPGGTWVTNTTITRSLYSLAGQVIATRVVGDPQTQNNGLFYFLGDHLGSTRMLTNTGGGVVSGTTAHFLPYGSYRSSAPAGEITDKGFTGHKHEDGLGLVYADITQAPGKCYCAATDLLVACGPLEGLVKEAERVQQIAGLG